MASTTGSPKPLYTSSEDPDMRPMGLRYIAASNSSPPAQMLEKYFSMSPTEAEHPRFNPLNKGRPRSSSLLNINDTVAMHLLVETAILDSNDYELLSFEEVEELKKEYHFLSNRIDSSRRKLALESKVRDAALSLSRLYQNKKGRRRSFLGNSNEVTQKTDDELVQSNQKCEKLLEELWNLSVRAWEIQRRLLQHSSGILGMTHQGGSRPMDFGGPKGGRANGPGGPSPNYPYAHGKPRHSMFREDEFDDRSLYRTHDRLDDSQMNGHQRGISADWTKYANSLSSGGGQAPTPGASDPLIERRLNEINFQLRDVLSRTEGGQSALSLANGRGSGVQEQLLMLEEGIKIILQSPPPPQQHSQRNTNENDSEETTAQLANLWSMMVLGDEEYKFRERSNSRGQHDGANDSDADDANTNYPSSFSLPAFSHRVEALYNKVTKLRSDKSSLRKQLSTRVHLLSEQNDALQQRMEQREEEMSMDIVKLEHENEKLMDEIQQRDIDLASTNSEIKALTEELDVVRDELKERGLDMSDQQDEIQALKEELQTLRQRTSEDQSSREQSTSAIEAEKKARKDLETTLTAKISEIQAQLTSKTADEALLLTTLQQKESELTSLIKSEELLRSQLQEKESQLNSHGDEDSNLRSLLREQENNLADMQNRFEEMKDDRNITKAELDASKAELEAHMAETDSRINTLQAQLTTLTTQKSEADAAKSTAEATASQLQANLAEKSAQLDKMDQEMRELVDKVATISTECALLKAELDSAYGSRKQRAAETAEAVRAAQLLEKANKTLPIDPTFLNEMDDLTRKNQALLEEIAALKAEREKEQGGSAKAQNLERRNALLQVELNGMLQDFEGLTKQSIEFENERTVLENNIDKMREKVEALETQLADERVRMLGVRSMSLSSNAGEAGGGGGSGAMPRSGRFTGDIPGESTSTTVLRSEFKKMMRDMRAEQMKALRAEQEERRKLEGVIRKLKAEMQQAQRKGPTSLGAIGGG